MYKKKQKEMPGLTPAAWRKAAAQEMGLDYNTYLALWKEGKEAAKAIKMSPVSTPTLPTAVSPGPTMKIPMKKAQSNKLKSGQQLFNDFNAQINDLKKAYADGELDYQDVVDIFGDLQAEYGGPLGQGSVQNYIAAAQKNMVSAESAKKVAIDSAKLFEKGLTTKQALAKEFKYITDKYGHTKFVDDLAKDYGIDLSTGTATAAAEASADAVATAAKATDEYIQTHLGPLNHDLAQQVYKKMKIDMPGATPATLRHAAADYLKVPYDDYLAAWKKPGATKVKSGTMPPNTTTPLSPSTTGKYSKVDITPDELKNELAKLYGPNGNPNYITLEHDIYSGQYTVQMPKGLLDSTAQIKVKQGIQDLGLEVKKTNNVLTIKSPAHKPPPPPEPLDLANPYNVTTYHDGTAVLDLDSGRRWTDQWWSTVSDAAKKGVKRYTTNAYRSINSALRKGGALTGDMRAMSEAMPYTTKQFTVFRGCGDEPGRSLTIDAFKVGKKFEDLGFMSTAVTPESAWRGVKLIIDLPPGTKGMYINSVSSCPGEMEYLIDAGTQFRVVSVKEGPNPANRLSGEVHLVAIPKKKV
jgi:hypothetical protein